MWHTNQRVFDHVVKVYESLEKELTFSELSDEQAAKARSFLQQTVGNQTRENILKAAVLFHDIAKTQTLIKKADGSASCPGHEHLAAGQVKSFAPLFNLDSTAEEYTRRMVLHHGFIGQIVEQVLDKPEKEDFFWSSFTNTVGDISFELVVMMRADLKGGDLDQTQPALFQQWDELLLRWQIAHLPS